MKIRNLFNLYVLLTILVLTACESKHQPTLTPALLPTATAASITPTPLTIGQAVTFDGLQVNLLAHQFSEKYTTQFDTMREPSAGMKFLWIQVGVKNITTAPIALPTPEHFSVLHFQNEIKPSSYARRKDYLDYTTLSDKIEPNQEIKSWIRFDVILNADTSSLWFVYLPKGSRVNFLPPGSPAWGDHPEYLWKLIQ